MKCLWREREHLMGECGKASRRWWHFKMDCGSFKNFLLQTARYFYVSPAGLRELHLLPDAATQWHTDSGDISLQEAPAFCTSCWAPPRYTSEDTLTRSRTHRTRPQVPFLTCRSATGNLENRLFQGSKSNSISCANSEPRWVDSSMYQMHRNRSISYKGRDSCYFCAKLI